MKFLEQFKKDGFTFRELGALFAIGAIANVYFLANFSFSIDDEMGATRKDPLVWVAQGRWTVYLVERLIFPQPSVPFAPFLVLIACMAIGYALLVRVHGLRVNWKTYAAYSVFCTFPTWWFISEFYSNVPAVSLGVLLTSLSVYLTGSARRGGVESLLRDWRRALGIVLLLACAIGAYQSMVLYYTCMSLGVVLLEVMRTEERGGKVVRQVLRKMMYIGLLAVCSIAVYGAVNIAAQRVSGAHSTYIDSFVNVGGLINAPIHRIESVLAYEWRVYAGDALIFGAAIPLASLVLVAATAAVIYLSARNRIGALIIWFIVLTIPFALHFLSGTEAMPVRSMLSLAYTAWLMTIILLMHERIATLVIAVAIIGVYQLEIVAVTSQYIASATVTQAHDRMVAADIYRRIGELTPDFDRDKPCLVDFYGHMGVSTVYATGWSSAMQGSFFDWENGNSIRIGNYLKVMGYQNVQVVDRTESRAMTPLYEGMSVWPAAGSVKKVGDRYLVKLSQDPDPIHAGIIK